MHLFIVHLATLPVAQDTVGSNDVISKCQIEKNLEGKALALV
jgi:hypothetical protein